MIVLSIDIGGEAGTGIVIYDSEAQKIMLSETFTTRSKSSGVIDFFYQIDSYINRYSPDLIIMPTPTAYRSAIKLHYQKIGVVRILADESRSMVIIVVDSNCKKLVFGEGSADKEFIAKALIKERKLKTEHERDAFMFIKAWETGDVKIQDS